MKFKALEDLDISDDFMFGLVMSNEGLCKEFIEVLLKTKLSKIVYIDTQKTEKEYYDMHGIRLDAYVESDGSIFEVEMQNEHYGELRLRARYYQGVIDTTNLGTSMNYKELKEVYILFVCKNDPFKAELPVYTIQRICKEAPSLDVSNSTHEVYVNSSAYAKAEDPQIRELLQYIYNKEMTGEFSQRLDNFIEEKKMQQEVKTMYNKIEMFKNRIAEDAREAGKEEGTMKERLSNALAMLQNKLDVALVAKCTNLSTSEVEKLQKTLA